MPDMSLEAQARRRLLAEGAPISRGNIQFAIEELQANPSLQETASSENDLVARQGGVTGELNRSRLPTTSMINPQAFKDKREMSPLRPDSDKAGDRYFTADSQFGSDPTANAGKAKATRDKASQMAKTDRQSGVMFKGGAGVTPGTTAPSRQGATPGTTELSVSTEPESVTTSVPVKATPLDPVAQTSAEVNAVSTATPTTNRRRPPVAQGARPGPTETNAARPQPTPTVPERLQAPEPPPVDVNRPQLPQNVPVAGGMNAANASGVPPEAQVEPQPGWGDMYNALTGWMPEGTGQRAQNVLGAGAAIGAPLLAAFMGMRGGAPAPLVNAAQNMRPRGAPGLGIGAAPAGPVVPPSPAAMGPTMNPVTAAQLPPGLAKVFNPQPPLPPPVTTTPPPGLTLPASPQTIGSQLMSSKGQVGMQSVPPAGPIPAAPIPPPAVQQAIGPALEAAAPKVARSAVTKAAPAAKTKSASKSEGKGRSGTARLPPTPGKGMTLEDARATSGGGKPQPKRGRARGNQ